MAIVGAGWLGRALAAKISGRVLATTRTGNWQGSAPDNVEVLALDLTAPAAEFGHVARADAVIIAVAPHLGGRRGPEAEGARRALYVEGTRRLLAAVPTRCRVVYVGSTSALPDRDGWLDEGCVEMPDSARGLTQRAAERVVAAHSDTNLVLRMGGLFGPDRQLQTIYRNRDPSTPRPGDGMAPTNLVHRDDAVSALLAALTRPNVQGVVHVVADGHTPRREMYARIAARSGLPAPRWEADAATHVPRGKRVGNLRLKLDLGVRLRHPWPA